MIETFGGKKTGLFVVVWDSFLVFLAMANEVFLNKLVYLSVLNKPVYIRMPNKTAATVQGRQAIN